MSLENLTWGELEKHHKQAQQAMQSELWKANEESYRLAERLEKNVRFEKIRRLQRREQTV